mmetsp:Transcript_24930/g.57543  ORF Transcript_24930/g.57543 Transcript_24930/m.57543 type:complete len:223 (+) Transcript_24930:317-985(+)
MDQTPRRPGDHGRISETDPLQIPRGLLLQKAPLPPRLHGLHRHADPRHRVRVPGEFRDRGPLGRHERRADGGAMRDLPAADRRDGHGRGRRGAAGAAEGGGGADAGGDPARGRGDHGGRHRVRSRHRRDGDRRGGRPAADDRGDQAGEGHRVGQQGDAHFGRARDPSARGEARDKYASGGFGTQCHLSVSAGRAGGRASAGHSDGEWRGLPRSISGRTLHNV